MLFKTHLNYKIKKQKAPHTYGQLNFDKGGKNIQWERESLFSKWCWKSWIAACKSMNTPSHHTQK